MAALNQRMKVDGGKKNIIREESEIFSQEERIEVILEKTGIVFSDL